MARVFKTPVTVEGDVSTSGVLKSTQSLTNEGGQVELTLPSSGSTLSGTNVTIDVYQNRLRIFESGGTNRGAYIDLSSATTGVGSNLLAGGTTSNSFTTIATPSGTSPVAASASDTLTITTDSYLTVTGNSSTDTIAFATGATSANTASKIVARDASGNFTAGVITATSFNSTSSNLGTNYAVGDDAYIGDVNVANTIRITGQQNAANGYVIFGNSDAKALGRAGTGALTFDGNTVWHAGNDGAGSGLDADLLDGLNSTAFAQLSGAAFTGNVSTTGTVTATGNIIGHIATNAQTASYTLVLADDGKLVEINNASANTVTIPTNASVAFPVGTQITILQTGAGQTSLAVSAGVTLNCTPQSATNAAKLRAQWSSVTLVKRATDTWVAMGDLTA